MKIQKGDAGYLRRRKRLLILEAVVSFGLVAALMIAGYVTTKTKLNLLTVVAVLGCLPASRILVNLIMVMPHDSIDEATELEISAVTEELTVAYDLVITSEKKAMPVAAVAIYNNTICGYVPVKKEANEMTFVEQAMDAAGASSKMRAIITNAIGMTSENQMYTTKAFRNGTAARAILNDSMVEKARADREAFLALTAEGMPHEEAAAQFVTDENFEAWYEETRTALEMCIAG